MSDRSIRELYMDFCKAHDKRFERNRLFRRIIQISSNPSDAINTGGVWALCNDGSLWFYRSSENDWHKMKAIPQDEEQE